MPKRIFLNKDDVYDALVRLVYIFAGMLLMLLLSHPMTAFAADGSGADAVLPSSAVASSTGNTLNFTFTAAEAMNSGGFTITVPADWSPPTSTNGAAGYTTVSSGAGIIGTVLDDADSATGWSAGAACSNGLSATTTIREEGSASIACVNGGESNGDVFYRNIAAQDWSGYTTVGFWVRTSGAVGANRLQFSYDNNNGLASPIASLNVPALSANTWTYVTVTLTGARTTVTSFGFTLGHNSAFDNVSIYVDDLLIGPGLPVFLGADVVRVDLLSLAAGQTVVVSYGSGGGANGATSPPTGRSSAFATQSRSSAAGTFTAISSSPVVTVNNPVPTLSTILPTSKNVGDSTFTLTLTGTNYNASSTVYFGGTALTTTYVSSTELAATVLGSLLTSASSVNMTVVNPTPGGGTSAAQVLSVSNPSPMLTAIAPTSTSAGSSDTSIVLTGSGFVSESVVRFNGSSISTTYNSSTQLTATVASTSLLIAGSYNVAVFNPGSGGGTSGDQIFVINNIVPYVDSISPITVEAGSGDFDLMVNGPGLPNNYNFASNAVVSIDGNPLATTFENPRHLMAVVPGSYVAVSGTHLITVFNPAPGGGTSTAVTLYVSDTVPPAIVITAPTKISNTVITDTTIHVTNTNISASNVIIDPSTTAGTSNFSCTQVDSTAVDCTVRIISDGCLVIKATDEEGFVQTLMEADYYIDPTPSVITIAAPTSASGTAITDTTIHVTDGVAITASNVIVDPSTTAGTSNLSCTQINGTTVDCTIRVTSSGNLTIKATDDATNVAASTYSGYAIESTPPVIVITAPTKVHDDGITNTTIHVTDNNAITASNVIVDPSTTAGTSNLSCTQTNGTTVDCTLTVTSNGNLTIKATDRAGNAATQTESGYLIEAIDPVISITAPTKLSNADITNTTIHVTDNNAITASNVIVDPSTTAGTSNLSCTQTNGTTVDCTIRVTSSGNLVISATDHAANNAQRSETNYVVDAVAPVVGITASTSVSSTAITNTMIHVTDNVAIMASNVTVDPSTTAGTSGLSCAQTNSTVVDCTIVITSSGTVTIKAMDDVNTIATSSHGGYVIESVSPIIVITAPTKGSNADIMDTTIHVTDNNAILAAGVVLDGSTTAFTHDFRCAQTNATTVDCTIEIDGSGDLTIRATDAARNVSTSSTTGYVIDITLPIITINTPTLLSTSTITNTTIHVTDGAPILVADVIIDPSTTAGTSNFSCSQTSSTAVDCAIRITSSGNLTIKATDSGTNVHAQTASGFVVDATLPVIVISASTTSSTTDIMDTTIHVTDGDAILAANVVVDPLTTAGIHNLYCTQTNTATVDCLVEIDSSGSLTIKATDRAGNVSTQTQSGYTVNHLGPTIFITAPTRTSSSTITDTTIHVVDATAVSSTAVLVDGSSTAGTSNFNCNQTNSQTVDCTIRITSSGDLVITATNSEAQTTTDTEMGYEIETSAPIVAFTAPLKTSSSTIGNTTVHVTDNVAITATSITIATSTTVNTNSFHCVQTNDTTVDCTVNITSSGDLVIRAVDDAGNVTTQSSTGYVIDVTLPTIVITAPTKLFNTTITNTTIHVIDDTAIASSSVIVFPSTTAGTSGFNCTQTDAKTVDCTISITSNGNLVIRATDSASNIRTDRESGYVVEMTAPVIAITAPTKTSVTPISDTTIHVTDNRSILAADVMIDGASTADISAFSCAQTNATTVDCTLRVDSNGDLVILATDSATNVATQTESGYVISATPPVISSVHAVPASSSASISWMTDSLTSSKVVYGPDTSYSSSTAVLDTSPRVTSHVGSITNLVACSTYHYRVVSVDAMSNAATSTDQIVTTTGCPGDAPVLSQTEQTMSTFGGSLSLAYGGQTVTIQVPSGYAESAASFQMKALSRPVVVASIGSPSEKTIVGNAVYDIHALRDSQAELSVMNGQFAITMSYAAGDIANVDPYSLVIYHYRNGTWSPLTGCSINMLGRTVVCVGDSFSVFALVGTADAEMIPRGGGGAPASGYLPPGGPFRITLRGGGTNAAAAAVTLDLVASSDVNRMALSRFADFRDAVIVPFASSIQWSLCGASVCSAGTYDVYVKFYQAYGIASAAQHLAVTLAPPRTLDGTHSVPVSTITGVLDPANLSFLLSQLNVARNLALEDGVLKLVYADAKDFQLTLTNGQAFAIRNFVVYGISPVTIGFGWGERRAIMRDYMETVHRSEIVWSDIERLATGQIPLTRNLALERMQVQVALPVFRRLFGHDPDFKNQIENLAWNTILYRIRFPRQLAKESIGLKAYQVLYRHAPVTPFSWAVVRVLGYVKQ